MNIINSSFSTGIVPKLCKKLMSQPFGRTRPPKSDLCNYRPISILPVLARMMENEIARQRSFCDNKHIIPAQQFGVRFQSKCEMALIYSLDGWMEAIDQGMYVEVLLIDLTKSL